MGHIPTLGKWRDKLGYIPHFGEMVDTGIEGQEVELEVLGTRGQLKFEIVGCHFSKVLKFPLAPLVRSRTLSPHFQIRGAALVCCAVYLWASGPMRGRGTTWAPVH